MNVCDKNKAAEENKVVSVCLQIFIYVCIYFSKHSCSRVLHKNNPEKKCTRKNRSNPIELILECANMCAFEIENV